MKKIYLLFLLVFTYFNSFSQTIKNRETYKKDFAEAYKQNLTIPAGLLEAVAWNNTRIRHISHIDESCKKGQLPFFYGVMGLVLNGQDYFKNNLITISKLSGYSKEEIIKSPRINILAYAKAYSHLQKKYKLQNSPVEKQKIILSELSEIPNNEKQINNFALNTQLYQIYKFLSSEKQSKKFGFQKDNVDFIKLFGKNNLKILKSKNIYLNETEITNENGEIYKTDEKETCPDYNVENCSWVASPNFSSRNGTVISAIVIHTVQGSYSSCIAWFQNPDANVSTQYVVRSSDGQITQMVLEENKAWHVGSENPYTIGYEHEGYVDDPIWYTNEMFQSSANLTINVCNDNNINTHRMFWRDTLDDGTALDYGLHNLGGETYCTKIKGHQHYPNSSHTDPGPYWAWDYYYKLVNVGNYNLTTFTENTGTFTDTGGETGNYPDDERKLWLIKPQDAEQVNITFNDFELETDYDFLYIYDGETVFSHLIGRYNTQSPGTVTANSGSMLIEFRSDCGINKPGWSASWNTDAANIENINFSGFEIIPNPISDKAVIKFSTETQQKANCKIYNTIGQLTDIINFDNCKKGKNSYNLDFSEYSKGIYFIVLQIDNNVYTKKIIVE